VTANCTLPRFCRFWSPSSSDLQAEVEEEEDFEEDDEDEDEGLTTVGAFTEATGKRHSMSATAELLEKSGGGGREGMLGSEGVGRLWRVVPTAASLGYERPASLGEGVGEGELSEEEDDDDDMEQIDEEEYEAEGFADEVGDTVRRALTGGSGHTVDNLVLEINSLKFAANRTFADCVRAVVPALLEDVAEESVKKAKVAALKKRLDKWAGVLERFVQSKGDQRALVEAIVESCETYEPLIEVFDHVLKLLYDRDEDILAEEPILQWADAHSEDAGPLEAKLLKQADGLLTWLREADDESEDEDEDEE